MNSITIELSDVQIKALEHDCVSIQELFTERANLAVCEMASEETQRRLTNGEGIPAGISPEDLVLESPMPSAVDRQQQAEEEMRLENESA